MNQKTSVLIIYTGGTIGMVEDNKTGSLKTFDFRHLLKHLPELKKFNIRLETFHLIPLLIPRI